MENPQAADMETDSKKTQTASHSVQEKEFRAVWGKAEERGGGKLNAS